nr:hypothetical protein CFP56_67147 [Quercus suber]
MRLRVGVDPWSPLLTGFMLKLNDGARVWIQCRHAMEPHFTNELKAFPNGRRGTFTMRPSWFPPRATRLKWTWVVSLGLFITNGEVEASQSHASDTESDSVTATMFSLDNLNDIKPEVRQGPS